MTLDELTDNLAFHSAAINGAICERIGTPWSELNADAQAKIADTVRDTLTAMAAPTAHSRNWGGIEAITRDVILATLEGAPTSAPAPQVETPKTQSPKTKKR